MAKRTYPPCPECYRRVVRTMRRSADPESSSNIWRQYHCPACGEELVIAFMLYGRFARAFFTDRDAGVGEGEGTGSDEAAETAAGRNPANPQDVELLS